MKDDRRYRVALFASVSHVMKAEKILKEAGIGYKIIPVPKSISTDCGVCVRFLPEMEAAVTEAFGRQVTVMEIRDL